MKNKQNREKGITLIALIITVIILIILAGVAISSLGNSGLFSKSKDAVNKYTEAQKNEEAELANYLNELEEQSKPPVEVPVGYIPIYTRADLEKISSGELYTIKGKNYDMHDYGKYILMNDINLAGSEWVPLPQLNGELDGNYKKIKNMTITNYTGVNAIGFISVLGGKVSKLALEDVNINVTDPTTITGSTHVGAIAGGGSYENFATEIYVTGKIFLQNGNVGGLFGGEGSVENAYNLAEVKVGNGNAGGIIGNTWMSRIFKTYNAGDISFVAGSAGALVGEYWWDAGFADAYWYDRTGLLTTFVGNNLSPDTNGFNQAKYTEDEMKQKISFTGFDFDNIWTIDEGNSMPKFKNFK